MAHSILAALPQGEIEDLLARDLPHWRFTDGHLVRVFTTYGWKGTLMVVNTIGHLAEAAWHHPDLAVSYAKVEVRLQSHDAGGITQRDFELARKIEQVVGRQPAREGLALEGTPQSAAAGYIKYD